MFMKKFKSRLGTRKLRETGVNNSIFNIFINLKMTNTSISESDKDTGCVLACGDGDNKKNVDLTVKQPKKFIIILIMLVILGLIGGAAALRSLITGSD